ncbi:MAG: TlpA disulfide reductase family protein [Candidatus Sericytochromatia bacterium]|nr:TlpA disulfide reductase family protein [Candidatus Sericytochromatia bacterium]
MVALAIAALAGCSVVAPNVIASGARGGGAPSGPAASAPASASDGNAPPASGPVAGQQPAGLPSGLGVAMPPQAQPGQAMAVAPPATTATEGQAATTSPGGTPAAPPAEAATSGPPPEVVPAAAPEPTAPPRVVMRALAPNISFLDAAGQSHTLSEWRGKFVVLMFFSHTCGICAKEVPKIQALTSLRSPDAVVLPIESTMGTNAQAAGFASSHGVSIPVYHDPSWEAPKTYLVKKFPQAFVVAPDFKVIEDVAGEASVEFYDIRFRRYFPSIPAPIIPGV